MAEEQEVTVLCDMRESRSGVITHLQSLGASVKVGELETGDYVLSADIAVERKDAADFISSIVDGRLFNQSGKMLLNYKRPVFLIAGDVYSTRSKIAREAIDGALSFLTVVEGITVLYVRENDPASVARLIYRMAKHAQNGLGYDVAFRRGKVEPGKGQALFAIEGLPGIGPTTAIRALNHFRSIHALVNANLEELKAVQGLGQKKAERVYESIHWRMPDGETVDSRISMFCDQE